MPWLVQLELSGTRIIGNITPAAGSVLGYVLECTIFGIKEEDECSQALVAPTLENMVSEKDVLAIVAEENSFHCSLSGENSGDIKGEYLISTLSGASLTISGE